MRVIAPVISQEDIFKAKKDDVGHCSGKKTKGLVAQHFWRPKMARDIDVFVRPCLGCQMTCPVLRVDTGLRQPVVDLFYTFWIDFSGPLPKTSGRTSTSFLRWNTSHNGPLFEQASTRLLTLPFGSYNARYCRCLESRKWC